MMLRLGVALLFFSMMSSCFIFMRPKPFFGEDGLPYGFGLSSECKRPYSLMVVLMLFAVLSYYLTVMFYR